MKNLFLFILSISFLTTCNNSKDEIEIQEVKYKGIAHYRISTPNATYYLEKQNGGFSSILDSKGTDWIKYSKSDTILGAEGAAADFRGLPNMVYQGKQNGIGHPGFNTCISEIINDTLIRVVSHSGNYEFSYSFTSSYAEMTINKADRSRKYWFLYEGPIAGQFNPESHFIISSEGFHPEKPSIFGDAPISGFFDWLCFGDENYSEMLYVKHVTPDTLIDIVYYMGSSGPEKGNDSEDGMVVMGFGRNSNTRPQMHQLHNKFRFGFIPKPDSEKENMKELIEQKLPGDELALSRWKYIQIDSTRSKWGDYNEPEWLRYFGLDMMDINNDKYKDILSGRYIYINPGKEMDNHWVRIDLGMNADGILFLNIDDDEFADAVALALPFVYWFEAKNSEGTAWESKIISENVEATGHINSQGYLCADIINGGKEEILFTAREGIYMAEIPKKPEKGNWNFINLGLSDGEEGLDAADIDQDGDVDIVAPVNDQEDKRKEPKFLYWFENPGNNEETWKRHLITKAQNAIDRVELADFNNDGMVDIAISEERFPGLNPDANLYVIMGILNDDTIIWDSHILTTQYSMNNLDAADIDRDGDMDLVTNEHKGKEHKTQLFINDGKANFAIHLLDKGKECHLGTIFSDLDNDGDFDLVGHAWDNYSYMHVWRNDALIKK